MSMQYFVDSSLVYLSFEPALLYDLHLLACDLDLLVNRFISVEDTNFALFNYVNEQNNEIEKLNDEIQCVSINGLCTCLV